MENTTLVENHLRLPRLGIVPQWVRTVELVYLTAIVVLGVPGNGLIILVQVKNKDKSSTDCLVLTMALFDFICSSFNAVICIIHNTRSIWKFIASTCLCKVFLFTSFATGVSSTLLVACVAIDRYVKTCKPLSTFYTTKKAKIVCGCISVVSVMFAVPTLPVFYLDPVLECNVYLPTAHILNQWNVFLVSMTMTAFIVISVSYIKVTVSLRKRHRAQMRVKMALAQETCRSNAGRLVRTTAFVNRVIPATQSSEKTNETTSSPVLGPLVSETRSSHANSNVCCTFNVSGQNTDVSCELRPKSLQRHHRKLTLLRGLAYQEQAMNKTTLIMSLISIVYMITHGFNWFILFVNDDSELSEIFSYISLSAIMINSITNPLFFFCLSSKFRTNAKKMCFKP